MVGRKSPPVLHHNSLPRKSNFHRNTPARRSAAGIGAEPLMEYFVPRSMSEFDISIAAGDSSPVPTFLPLTVRAPRKNTNSNAKQKEKMVTFEDEMASRIGKSTDLQDVFM
ncbi:uncharacterized protein LOC143193312 [Rhynchophorus ferrugineus]|uniref:Uncharacterized protein n=1 Tax=Rhynchophorus ferrugineus TaxID=354439 RepID=A0A834HRL0_RHYFE|nr:hypothetical protein GWI33_019343 [Rhynchophorus ferrugineus]